MDEIATKLLQATNDPNKYETTLTITGAGGFGKTMIATSLCYHSDIEKRFTNGFVFIELGPQATDPSIKLSQLYHLLTGENLKPCDVNHAEQEIKQVTSNHYRNLLVIIDDVWYVEDAKPLMKAFSNCKTILTTRMNDIERYIPSQQSVTIGPMTQNEAISLLTKGIINNSRLSQEDKKVLDELAQDVHLWPLLLSLIRGQLSHYLKQYQLSYHNAIQNVQTKLYHKGLTAFDAKNVIRCRDLAVEACIEITLELLTKSLSEKIKLLILWTGIGTSLQTAVLKTLWNISKQNAEEALDVLWHYGLIQFTNVTILDITQCCVEVHAVISQYIVDTIDSKEVDALSPFVGSVHASVHKELSLMFTKSRKAHKLTKKDLLEHRLNEIQNLVLPASLKFINMHTITNPHMIKLTLQRIRDCLMDSYKSHLLSSVDGDIKLQIDECKEILKNAHKICRKLNQDVQKYLFTSNYDKLVETVENFFDNYRLGNVAQKAVIIAKKIIPHCDGEELYYMSMWCEDMQTMTTEYHGIKTLILPNINFLVKALKQIATSLQNESPDIEQTFHYFTSGKYEEEAQLLTVNYLFNLQKVSPNIMLRLASEYGVV